MKIKFIGIFVALAVLITGAAFAAANFPEGYCFPDPGGNDVGMPQQFAGQISGFDINKLCLQYDEVTDILYVGIETFAYPDAGLPIIFGDADGDGNPGSPAIDPADLGVGEFFSFVMDFDNDQSTGLSFVAGVPFQKDINNFAITQVADPTLALPLSFDESYYGAPIETSSDDSGISFNPDVENPYLEFAIINLSQIAGFEAINLDDPDYNVGIYFYTGNLMAGIGQDYFGDGNSLTAIKFADIILSDDEEDSENNGGDQNTPPPEESNDPADNSSSPENTDNNSNGGEESGSSSDGGTCSLIKHSNNPSNQNFAILLFPLSFLLAYRRGLIKMEKID